MSKLVLQVNERFVPAHTTANYGGQVLMFTPPLDEDYWLFRVELSDKNAIVGFPKFGTIGIGFQHETDWNTNLPYQCETEEIYNHIKHNKGDEGIRKPKAIEAIEMVRTAAKRFKELA